MKILFLGWLAEGQTSRMRMEVMGKLGHTITPLDYQAIWNRYSWASRRLQQKFARGPAIARLNRRVVELARRNKPDLLWAEKQEYLRPDTLETLRHLGVRLLHYTPDPYFTLSWKRTKLMDAALPLFDYAVTSKRYELNEYRRMCQQVIYMPLGYAEAVHRPVVPGDIAARRAYSSDVAFLGGWEPRRETLLNALACTDCNLKIWGYGWDHLVDGRWTLRRAYRLRLLAGKDSFRITKNERIAAALQGGEVYGDAYAWALAGARINVGFLRHICPDQHTTRTFEIPACGSMMIADRTDEHREFFEEGKEAEFFSSEEELVEKVRFYLKHETSREKVAYNGYQRCLNSGYSYRERLADVLTILN